MPIQILPEVVATQIAAGEVVERPASVAKELLENALDAGARTIRIEAETGGRRLIRVTDDGCGIAGEEVELAFARHATSKIQRLEDLDHIQTLGFRGEALASIASVARVTLLTRTGTETSGTLLRLEGGHLVEHRATGAPTGTVVSVENLFFNTPARLKFMKAETTERRHIDSVVTRYAMAYPNVRFTLLQDGRTTFSTTGSGDLAEVLVEALGLDAMRDMLEVVPLPPSRPDLPPIAVHGYTSAPHLNRNTRSHITLFVNGRYIQDSSLSYAASQAYHTLMPSDRYPVSVLMISLAPGEVDVNVHPTKAEVRFRSAEAVFSAVQRAIRHAIAGQAPVPSVNLRADEGERFGRPLGAWGAVRLPEPDRQMDLGMNVLDAGRRSQQIGERSQFAGPVYPAMPITGNTLDGAPAGPRTLPPLRVLGQVGASYIVAEGPAGLYLVDQHAAHERILYEQFMRDQADRRPILQHTLDSVVVELAPPSARLIEENLDALRAVGFDLEAFSGNAFRVRAVPAALADRLPQEALAAILDDLEIGAEPGAATLEAKVILRVCKAAAIKAGQTLSYDEMQSLLRQLERCSSPRTCPHGRPTMIHMSAEQLAREFGRT